MRGDPVREYMAAKPPIYSLSPKNSKDLTGFAILFSRPY